MEFPLFQLLYIYYIYIIYTLPKPRNHFLGQGVRFLGSFFSCIYSETAKKPPCRQPIPS
ncbi:hypothetical protein B14911_13287 [Bacillus sp. NRRL B-14911]|uniref:Uncharacterized protein n=1 Tax=Bacillus infantis NRRL B-14911 TaxID=1367477 RepID=U5LG53_9BACI|nr:hypothetical protein N288_24960 [Bacillus infantis NRRL B-14911]EAR67740.1 hypothetical protein B14911_13287 [Bacillus sp. NRRL B-14911]